MIMTSRPKRNHDHPNQSEIIALIKDGLYSAEDQGEEKKPDAIEPRDVAFNAAAVKQRTSDGGDRQSDDNIRVEEGAPSEIFGVPAAHEDADRKGHHAENAPDSDSDGSFFRRIFAKQHSLSDRENDAAGKPEKKAHRTNDQMVSDIAQRKAKMA